MQASLALTLASEDVPKNKDKALIEDEVRDARKYNANDNEVVVDIEDDEKKQYYETNYDTSKSCNFYFYFNE